MKKILFIDDEPDLHTIMRFNLKEAGFGMDSALSAEEALNMKMDDYDLILLDIMMDELDGLEFLKILKEDSNRKNIPIVLLTAKTEEMDKVLGLEMGADDYITKPFSPRELVARIKAVLRRYKKSRAIVQNSLQNQYNRIHLDEKTKALIINGNRVHLTWKEYHLLEILMDEPAKVFSREELLKIIWVDSDNREPRWADALVKRVRKKMGNYRHYLETHSGFGYSFNIPDST
ncbi:MAG: response regulator transcription factor [Spirochaetes bacterium]|nr:response regulator transcription factor [Spirochaetota bacterium]